MLGNQPFHFIATDVSAMGLKSFRLLHADVARDRKMLKILVRILVSWSAQALSTLPGTPLGPAAFLGSLPSVPSSPDVPGGIAKCW